MSKLVKQMEMDALRKSFGGEKNFVVLSATQIDSATDYNMRKKLRDHATSGQ